MEKYTKDLPKFSLQYLKDEIFHFPNCIRRNMDLHKYLQLRYLNGYDEKELKKFVLIV